MPLPRVRAVPKPMGASRPPLSRAGSARAASAATRGPGRCRTGARACVGCRRTRGAGHGRGTSSRSGRRQAAPALPHPRRQRKLPTQSGESGEPGESERRAAAERHRSAATGPMSNLNIASPPPTKADERRQANARRPRPTTRPDDAGGPSNVKSADGAFAKAARGAEVRRARESGAGERGRGCAAGMPASTGTKTASIGKSRSGCEPGVGTENRRKLRRAAPRQERQGPRLEALRRVQLRRAHPRWRFQLPMPPVGVRARIEALRVPAWRSRERSCQRYEHARNQRGRYGHHVGAGIGSRVGCRAAVCRWGAVVADSRAEHD